MSESTRCWWCKGKLVGKNGQPKPPLIFAEVRCQTGDLVRVHKICLKDVELEMKKVTAAGWYNPDDFEDD